MLIWGLFIVSTQVGSISSSSEHLVVSSIPDAVRYLLKYSYINTGNKNGDRVQRLGTFEAALMNYQQLNGLKETGLLDAITLKLMNRRRCGNPDVVSDDSPKNLKLVINPAEVTRLTYRISNYPRCFRNRLKIRQIMAKAFRAWSNISNVDFIQTKSSEAATIHISFEKNDHGDSEPFKNSGETVEALAHAVLKDDVCLIHFNDGQNWSIDKPYGKDLFQVAVHEIGHCLNFDHILSVTSWMYPYYPGYNPSMRFSPEDIHLIQSKFGKPSNTPQPRIPSPYQEEAPDLCMDSAVDAALAADNKIYVFKSDFYWEITKAGFADGSPGKISEDWPGLPGHIDAAFVGYSGKFYFFKGSEYWRFKGKTLDAGYPRRISDGFKGIPNDVEAAVSNCGPIYFFKEGQYWVYQGNKKPHVDSHYPLTVGDWEGLRGKIDAALEWIDGHIYFLKGQFFYKWKKKPVSMGKKTILGPYFSGLKWFNCWRERG